MLAAGLCHLLFDSLRGKDTPPHTHPRRVWWARTQADGYLGNRDVTDDSKEGLM